MILSLHPSLLLLILHVLLYLNIFCIELGSTSVNSYTCRIHKPETIYSKRVRKMVYCSHGIIYILNKGKQLLEIFPQLIRQTLAKQKTYLLSKLPILT